jgi:hypothetical protein
MDRLQTITNDIIRRQITPREPPEKIRSPFGGESKMIGKSIPLLMAIEATGGSDPIFQVDPMILELVQTMPGPWLDELMLPPQIGCDDILTEMGWSDEEIADNQAENNANNPAASGGDAGDDLDSEDDAAAEESEEEEDAADEAATEEEEEEEDAADEDSDEDDDIDDGDFEDNYIECAEIELGWLKILLIICKVIGMLKKIIDFVLSIIMPIIAIVQLAAGAWLNPTNIAKIIQLIIQMVIAIIVMIIAMIIQLIWDLLNLDCICDMTEQVIDEIRKCFSAFAALANQFNPTGVSLLLDKVDKTLLDPLAAAAEQFKNNAEGWLKMKNEVADLLNPDPAKRKQMMEAMASQVKGGVTSGVLQNPNLNKAMNVAGKAGVSFSGSATGKVGVSFATPPEVQGAIDSIRAFSDFSKVQSKIDKMKNKGKDALNNAGAAALASAQLVGISVSTKEE